MSSEPIRAFLSHASEEKNFVQAVAERLGRQFCLFDKYEFASGVEFAASISAALDKSGVFVLFASERSLRKEWVQFEMEGALARKVSGSIDRILVYVLGTDGSLIESIPKPFQKAKIEVGLTPNQVARDVATHIEEVLRSRAGKYYVGRGRDADSFSRLLLKRVDRKTAKIFVVAGLPGIGRREFIRHAASDYLSLRKSIEIRAKEGHTIQDVAVQMMDARGGFADYAEFKREAARLFALPDDDALDYVVDCIAASISASEITIVVDEGGLMRADGTLDVWAESLFRRVALRSGAYISGMSTRRPSNLEDIGGVFHRLQPIDQESTQLLISQLAEDAELVLEDGEVEELAKYVAGYPPAATYAVQQAREYGAALVIGDKERLVEFRRKLFFDYIDKLGLKEQPVALKVLRVLSTFSPLPLAAIGACIRETAESLSAAIVKLVDLSLVSVEGGLYRIADPVSEASIKHFGLPSLEEARKVAQALSEYLVDQAVGDRRLDVSRALFRATRLAGDVQTAGQVVRLRSDIVGMVSELYHQRRYEDAVAAGELALEESPNATFALSYLIRSYVYLERWARAETRLEDYRKQAPARDYLFLSAFMAKRRGEIDDAISLYEQAKAAGKTGVSISRELSQCYVLTGDYDKAKRYLEEALAKEPDNRFVIDLSATIASNLGDRDGALEALARLEAVDGPMFYWFRKSRVHWAFGERQDALEAAREAVKQDARPTFQVLAQLALCEQAYGDRQDAATLIDRLDRDFSSARHDVRIGLRVRLLLADSRATEAARILESTRNKSGNSYKGMKRDVLERLAQDPQLDAAVRAEYLESARELRNVIGDAIPNLPEIDV